MKNNSKEIELKFNLPEFNKKDINLRISKNLISIKAEKKKENKAQKKDFFHAEKSSRSFNYTTSVPTIKPKEAKVDFKKGVLTIKVPKK